MKQIPLVYSCSGCSSAGQAANALALKMDRDGAAEMSCIAGVGGGVAPLVKQAQAAEQVIAIDGCPLHCALHSLRLRGVEPVEHIDLSKLGVKKLKHQDPDLAQMEQLYQAWIQSRRAAA
jgi:uncharacterized metal-binding protein